MADVLIRNVDADTLEALKARARQHSRSLQVELKSILEEAAKVNLARPRRLAARIRRSLSGGDHSDSAALLTNDRRR
jgi:plasmid stability protein